MIIASNATIIMYLGTFAGKYDIESGTHRKYESSIDAVIKITYHVRQINNFHPETKKIFQESILLITSAKAKLGFTSFILILT